MSTDREQLTVQGVRQGGRVTLTVRQAFPDEGPAFRAAREAVNAVGGVRAFDTLTGMQAWELAMDAASRAVELAGSRQAVRERAHEGERTNRSEPLVIFGPRPKRFEVQWQWKGYGDNWDSCRYFAHRITAVLYAIGYALLTVPETNTRVLDHVGGGITTRKDQPEGGRNE